MIYEIVKDISKLTTPCEKFNFMKPQMNPSELAHSLRETMQKHNGLGLAANQIGFPYHVFCINSVPDILVFFNSRIVETSQEVVLLEEGCLSFPNLIVNIKRPKNIKIRFAGPDGIYRTLAFTGITARTVQHELEHVNGQLFFEGCSRLRIEKSIKNALSLGVDYKDKNLLKFARKD